MENRYQTGKELSREVLLKSGRNGKSGFRLDKTPLNAVTEIIIVCVPVLISKLTLQSERFDFKIPLTRNI